MARSPSHAKLNRLLDVTISTISLLDNPHEFWSAACGERAAVLHARLTGCFQVRWRSRGIWLHILDEGVWTGLITWTPSEVTIHLLVRSFATSVVDLTPRIIDEVADDGWLTSEEHSVARERFEGSFARVLVPPRRAGSEPHYARAAHTNRE